MGVRLGGNTSGISAVRLHGCANDLQLSQPFDGVGLFAPRSLSMVIAFTVQGNRATSHPQAYTLIPATCRSPFASVLPVATPPKAIDVWSCRRGAASFVADNACGRGRVHRISISVVFGIPVSLQPSVELEVAHCTESSWDAVELSQRVLNFDESGLWIGQSAFEESCTHCGFATDCLQC